MIYKHDRNVKKEAALSSYLFETLGVSHQDVLTHQFLDQRVRASVQLSQEAQAETLQPSSRETVQSEYLEVMGMKIYFSSSSHIKTK